MVWPARATAQSSGVLANHSGLRLEKSIEDRLRRYGFEVVPAAQWREARLYDSPNRYFAILDAVYKSIYGWSRIEFLLLMGSRQILVEVKRQQVSGSYDEKLAFVYLTAKANLPDREFVLVMAGDGWRERARAWIERKARETPGFNVVREEAFEEWLEAAIQRSKH